MLETLDLSGSAQYVIVTMYYFVDIILSCYLICTAPFDGLVVDGVDVIA